MCSYIPKGYDSPSFPSLYWPINPAPGAPTYLYYARDIWRFTLYWTLLVYAAFHLSAGLWAFVMRPSKLSVGVPLLYAIIGGIEATIAGTLVGSM
jgi:Putative transmembrane protein 170